MLSYITKDLDLVNEIETFIHSKKPNEKSECRLAKYFGECKSSSNEYWWIQIPEDDKPSCDILFPHLIVAIMGHAGSGKSYTLKRLAGRYRTMFYAPTNQAGINLQNILWSEMLFPSSKKNVYRTIHSFFNIHPDESKQLGKMVQDVMNENPKISDFDQYLELLCQACIPFCEILFKKEIEQGAISPVDYTASRDDFCKLYKLDSGDCVHERVVEYIRATGERKHIPEILLYDTCVLEEAGRCADYLAYLYLVYYYFMHFKYETFIWRQTVPVMMFVGSATQSRVIDEFSTLSALTFLGQPFMKDYLIRSGNVKMKMCKDNRRATTGDIENKTTLSLIIGKLELRKPVTDSLRKKFNDVYVTEEKNFFDAEFKPDYFRIAKRHDNLKVYKDNVLQQNVQNKIIVNEYLLTKLDCDAYFDLEGLINLRLRSESFDRNWINTRKMTQFNDDDFHVYKTNRTLIRNLRYLLIDHHSLYLRCFNGTVDQLFEVCEILHPYLTSHQKIAFLDFMIRCAQFIWEDVFAKDVGSMLVENNVVFDKMEDENKASLEKFQQMKSLLQNAIEKSGRLMKKMFTYVNDKKGIYLSLPKDTFSFVLQDISIEQAKDDSSMVNAKLLLKLQDCLTMKMFYKTKPFSTEKLNGHNLGNVSHEEPSHKPIDFEQYRKTNSDIQAEKPKEDMFDEDDVNADKKSFFKTIPLALHICSTIDSTQGLTIHSPIIALLRKEDRAEDMIVAFTRPSNPDTLLVANKVFDRKFEPIDPATKSFIRTVHTVQKNDGWI